ncbi:hypothetical protein A1Q2_05485 [Trichosporon asahii var. asahii CBS 8904]|uniref:Uncharacterized protein n=2 Tax=Trichosporon asahii var. asahii TaxID=189963 RepID=K1VLJ0_TRIAC|nr:hypothetical protein A1Q1_06082 [Trichosporon asahii var. asahii CBS 2479]EJT45466.1 hypothetical protein A1Q1_06082 [Trichosporon asahii var. asahii CBS 2479]EKD00142.1 hypothetical protein A1Q2_05485 [Trichosporon asahii var. asahii CBS 8904]
MSCPDVVGSRGLPGHHLGLENSHDWVGLAYWPEQGFIVTPAYHYLLQASKIQGVMWDYYTSLGIPEAEDRSIVVDKNGVTAKLAVVVRASVIRPTAGPDPSSRIPYHD